MRCPLLSWIVSFFRGERLEHTKNICLFLTATFDKYRDNDYLQLWKPLQEYWPSSETGMLETFRLFDIFKHRSNSISALCPRSLY
jgi:hypothetical protein